LGISARSPIDEKEVGRVFRKKSLEYHPDKNTAENQEWAADQFKKLQKAKETVINKFFK